MSEFAESRTFRLSPRLAVTMTAGHAGFLCEWEPGIPSELSPAEMQRYRAGRDEMLGRLAERMGTRVLVVE
jgi:hypothetical protein